MTTTSSFLSGFTVPESRKRRLAIAAAIYAVCTAIFLASAAPQTLTLHTQYNHYALQAQAWLHGRLDIDGGPPAYAGGNDFAAYNGKTYITFPPFPALLMLPFVALAGDAADFRDGQLIIELAGLAPAFLFLVLEKLRRGRAREEVRSTRSESFSVAMALLFAFGTVFYFTTEQGTVWFAAHVVGTSLLALYVLFALDAERPFLAGLCLACAFATRPPMLLTGALFAMEAVRTHSKGGIPSEGTPIDRLRGTWEALDKRALGRDLTVFALPIAAVIAVESCINHFRFETWNPNVGHEYLQIAWQSRVRKWGLFSTHFLAKNLGVALTILPWLPPKGAQGAAPFQVNVHGLAMWFTMPFYLWVLWPKRTTWLYAVVAVSAALPAFQDLLYQNSGWEQFGYRFSNDYSVLLFVLLAIGERSTGWLFRTAAAWALAWNVFGALSFHRRGFEKYYYLDGSQTVLYQPD